MSTAASEDKWWEKLPGDIAQQSDRTELNDYAYLRIAATAALDRVARTGLGAMVCTALAPLLLVPGGIERERERLQFYRRYADKADVETIFPKPPAVAVREDSSLCDALSSRLSRAGMIRRRLSFESPFLPLQPALQEEYLSHRGNRRARALHYRHADGPRPTLLFMHGQSLDSYRINSWWFELPALFRQGYDILLVTLPFHGERADRGQVVSGIGFYTGGLARTNEAMLQGICDARVWLDYLFDYGAPQVGVSGLSLGGYLSALLASVDDRLAFAIPNSPVVAPVDMALEWQPVAPLARLLFRISDFNIGELRHGMALHSPLTFRPRLPPERLFIIGGAGDRFTSPRFVRLLHEHWQGSRLHWFPGNHILHLQQGEYLREIRNFIDQSVFAGSM